MRKNYYTFFIGLILSMNVMGQSFTDNFDTYTAGTYLAQSNSAWTTWTNKPGGADDVKISSAKAKSGSNSLYFSSTAATGGPSDVVLPFGGNRTTGTFNLSMNIFVDNLKKAYFNLQEQTIMGKGWSVDVNLDSTGKFNLVNTTSGVLLVGTYTQNAWIKVEFNIDLNTNTWDFLIDGVSKGQFQNSYRQIAAMDIYPIKNSSYYIDDVAYTYTPYTPSTLNASVTFVDKVAGKLATQVVKPTVEIRNLGTTAITSASIDLLYNGATETKTVSGLNLASMATTTIAMDNAITILKNASTLVATVKTVNGTTDDKVSDNAKTIYLNPVTPAPGKMVVAEEATGTWCQWCPRGAVFLKNMSDKYNGLIIGIAVHNNDPMTDWNYDKGMGSRVSGYPSMLIDRGAAKDPSISEADFLDRIIVPAAGNIRNGATYNSTTRELKVSLTTKFNKAVTGTYKIAFVLIEDGITGTTSGYNQSNAYANNANGVMGGFELLPNPVPASQMVYDHVGRLIYPNFPGLNNSFPASINANDSFTHNFSVILNPSYNFNKLDIAGILIDPSGRIDNGSKTTVEEAIVNGFVSGTMVLGVNNSLSSIGPVSVYPNPSATEFNVIIPEQMKSASSLQVFDLQGKLIETVLIQGRTNFGVDAQNWPSGVYFGVIHNEQGSTQIKFVKE